MLAHGFKGFNPWSPGPVALGLWQHRTPWQEQVGRGGLFTLWLLGNKEKDRKGLESQYLLQGDAPTDLIFFH